MLSMGVTLSNTKVVFGFQAGDFLTGSVLAVDHVCPSNICLFIIKHHIVSHSLFLPTSIYSANSLSSLTTHRSPSHQRKTHHLLTGTPKRPPTEKHVEKVSISILSLVFCTCAPIPDNSPSFPLLSVSHFSYSGTNVQTLRLLAPRVCNS